MIVWKATFETKCVSNFLHHGRSFSCSFFHIDPFEHLIMKRKISYCRKSNSIIWRISLFPSDSNVTIQGLLAVGNPICFSCSTMFQIDSKLVTNIPSEKKNLDHFFSANFSAYTRMCVLWTQVFSLVTSMAVIIFDSILFLGEMTWSVIMYNVSQTIPRTVMSTKSNNTHMHYYSLMNGVINKPSTPAMNTLQHFNKSCTETS